MRTLIRYTLLLILIYVGSTVYFYHLSENQKIELEKEALIKKELSFLEQSQQNIQSGHVKSYRNKESFHSKDLDEAISQIEGHSKASNFVWQDHTGTTFAYAARGVDKNYYFANSYLIGFQPYETNKLWQPLVTLAIKKTYQFDQEQYGHKWQDIWQNSYQAYLFSYGDCEDHAILLADWLIEMGYDARVVIGRVPSGGHAWVILFHEGKEYLLEATDKRRPRSLGDFKLAKYAPEYQPKYQFNRTRFWAYTGANLTTRYSGANWIEASSYFPDSPWQATYKEASLAHPPRQ